MGAIKGVGESALQEVINEREDNGPFTDIFNLTERVDPKNLTRGTLEILIKTGALDCFGPNRAQHTATVDRAVQAAISKFRDKKRGQKSLFDDDSEEVEEGETTAVVLPEAADWTHSQKLANEKEVFGFYLTSHPLTQHAENLSQFTVHNIADLSGMNDKADVIIGGMVGSIKKARTKKTSRNGHQDYVNFDLEGVGGIVRCIMWPEEFARSGEKVVTEQICIVRGRVDLRGREANVIVNKLLTMEEAEKEFTQQVAIKFQRGRHSEHEMRVVREILDRYPGPTEVLFVVESTDDTENPVLKRYYLSPPGALRVSASPKLRQELAHAIGEDQLQFRSAQKSTPVPR